MFPLPRDPVAWFSGILRWHLASVTEMLGYISLLTRCVCVCVALCVGGDSGMQTGLAVPGVCYLKNLLIPWVPGYQRAPFDFCSVL